jgi:DNA-binding FadR family transcriptional regulator
MYQKTLLSEKVAESIITAIKNGFYAVGDQMPNEIQLSEELGVSRATLREAIKILISKRILEVKRGIGTFVSDTPGFSMDVVGLDFLDLSAQISDIQRTMRYFDLDELATYRHLSYDAQKSIFEMLSNTERMPNEMLQALLDTTEKIALFRNGSFKNRMISLTHEAFRHAIKFSPIKADTHLTVSFEAFFDALGDEMAKAHYDEFMMRVRLMAQEA